MRKKVFLIATLFLIASGVAYNTYLNQKTKKEGKVCFKNFCFNLELAVTPEERSRGLMFRKHLDPDKGMLFIFNEEGEYSFWMKNTLIPLDIIWINSEGKVVFIKENAQPCKETECPFISPGFKAKYVLEINGGISRKIGLKKGDKLDFLFRDI